MKRNYNGVSKGKVIPLTEVKPGWCSVLYQIGRSLLWVGCSGAMPTVCSVQTRMACHKYLYRVVMGMTIGSTQQVGTKH